MHPPTSDNTEPVPPSRRELRAQLVWAARWLIGRTAFHRGPIAVQLSEGSTEKLTIRPKASDEIYTANSGPTASDAGAGMTARLLAHLVSPDGFAILTVIAQKGTAAAKTIHSATGIERSRCYSLVADLRERGLITDEGDGYEIADRDVWDAVREMMERQRAG